ARRNEIRSMDSRKDPSEKAAFPQPRRDRAGWWRCYRDKSYLNWMLHPLHGHQIIRPDAARRQDVSRGGGCSGNTNCANKLVTAADFVTHPPNHVDRSQSMTGAGTPQRRCIPKSQME